MGARKTLTERGMVTIWPKTIAHIQALVAESPESIALGDFVNDILDTYLTNHRSKKPLRLSDERFTERTQTDGWETMCM